MPKAVEPSCFSLPCSIERNAKSVSAITLIALVALGAVAVGVMAILANMPNPPQGLGVMSEIGMKGGIAMTASGGTLFIGTLVMAARLKSRESQTTDSERKGLKRLENTTVQQKEWHEPERNYLSFELDNQWTLLYTQSEWEAFEKENIRLKVEELQKKDPEITEKTLSPRSKKNAKTQAQNDAARPIVEKLLLIYPYADSLPTIYNPHHNVNGELEKQFALILLNNQEILDLKLEDIAKYDPYQMHILIQRLPKIQEDAFEPKKEPPASPTIRTLLSLSTPKEILEIVEGRSNLEKLLAPKQLFILFKKPIPYLPTGFFGDLLKQDLFSDANWISRLLPIKTQAEKEHTRIKLAELNTHQATASRLSQLPLTHILLLPDTYFESSNWQWTPERFQMIMKVYKLESEEVTRIAQTLKNATIQERDEQLTANHFPLFSDQQLRDIKGFPWVDFSHKEGWGPIAREKIELRQKETRAVEKGRIAINPNRLPWDRMHLEALKEFFKPEPEGQTQKQNLAELSIANIQTLQGVWDLEHLKFFTHEQRCSPDFPWGQFIKTGIGKELRQIYQNRSDKLAGISLPWEKLDATEIGTLFSLDKGVEIDETKRLLGSLDIKIIKKIAPHLVVGHLNLLPQDILRHSEFPWISFFGQKGIGTFLNQRQALTIDLQDRLPWTLLSNDEVNQLFSNISNNYDTRSFFTKFKVSSLIPLAPKLEANYITSCSPAQTSDPKFPWEEFLKKAGIGLAIRKAYATIGLKNIPWDKQLVSKEEMTKMLTHVTDQSYCSIETFLQALDCSIVSIIQEHIPVADVALFSIKQLTHPAFPWSPFICRQGIGVVLSELLIKHQQVSASIPWSTFNSAEEFKTVLSGKQGDTEKKQAFMQAIPIDQFQTLVTKFGKETLTAIVASAQYDYQRRDKAWFTIDQQALLKP